MKTENPMLTEGKPSANKRHTLSLTSTKQIHVTNLFSESHFTYSMCPSSKYRYKVTMCRHSETPSLPCPLSKNSVIYWALQGDHGKVLLRWTNFGAIMWCPSSCPNHFSQFLESSWGMLSTCPKNAESRGESYYPLKCNNRSIVLFHSI